MGMFALQFIMAHVMGMGHFMAHNGPSPKSEAFLLHKGQILRKGNQPQFFTNIITSTILPHG